MWQAHFLRWCARGAVYLEVYLDFFAGRKKSVLLGKMDSFFFSDRVLLVLCACRLLDGWMFSFFVIILAVIQLVESIQASFCCTRIVSVHLTLGV